MTPPPWPPVELVPGPAHDGPWPQPPLCARIPLPASWLTPPLVPPPVAAVVLHGLAPEPFPLIWRTSSGLDAAFDVTAWLAVLRREGYRPGQRPPLSSRLPFHYHRVPMVLRRGINTLLCRWQPDPGAVFPFDPRNVGVALVARAWAPVDSLPTVFLTHDVESADGFQGALRMAAIEESLGLRSSWNVVPNLYPLDERVMGGLLARGHEIGLHGLSHDNREAFLPPEALAEALQRLEPLRRRFAMVGYRGPSWYRRQESSAVLAGFFRYDASVLDCDFVCPGEPGGVGVVHPFQRLDGLWEIPCTLPYEAPLYHGVAWPELLSWWDAKITLLRDWGGVLTVLTHPEAAYAASVAGLASYEGLLRRLVGEGWRVKLPREVGEGPFGEAS